MKRLLLLVPFILMLAGCFSLPRENLKIHRYTFRPEMIGTVEADTTIGRSLSILPFYASSPLHADRILFVEEKSEMSTYYYHRWIGSPENMLTSLAIEDLTEWGLFGEGVFTQPFGIVPSYEMQGHLLHMHADNRRGRTVADFEVVISVFAISPETMKKQIVMQKTYSILEDRENDRVESYIPAASRAVEKFFEELHEDLSITIIDWESRSENFTGSHTSTMSLDSLDVPPDFENEQTQPTAPGEDLLIRQLNDPAEQDTTTGNDSAESGM